jgi:negative regulator of sigma E activity
MLSGERDGKDRKERRRDALLLLPGGVLEDSERSDRDAEDGQTDRPAGISDIASCNPLRPDSNLHTGWYRPPEASKTQTTTHGSGESPDRASEAMVPAGVSLDLAPTPVAPEPLIRSLAPRRARPTPTEPRRSDASGRPGIAAVIASLRAVSSGVVARVSRLQGKGIHRPAWAATRSWPMAAIAVAVTMAAGIALTVMVLIPSGRSRPAGLRAQVSDTLLPWHRSVPTARIEKTAPVHLSSRAVHRSSGARMHRTSHRRIASAAAGGSTYVSTVRPTTSSTSTSAVSPSYSPSSGGGQSYAEQASSSSTSQSAPAGPSGPVIVGGNCNPKCS